MTIIQPAKSNTFLNIIIAILVLALIVGSFWLVALYNRLVNLDHGISSLNAELDKLQASNVETKKSIFALFDSGNLGKLAESRQLVQDRNPQYLAVNPAPTVAKAGQ